MMKMIMMKINKKIRCHRAAKLNLLYDGGDGNDDDDVMAILYSEQVSQICDTYSFHGSVLIW